MQAAPDWNSLCAALGLEIAMALPRTPILWSGLAAVTLLSAGCIEHGFVEFEGDDIFYQLEAGEVDVLLVVDNSCSMEPYQNRLSENFDQFLTFFIEGDVDYQIGVITTSVAPAEAIPGTVCDQAAINQIPEPGGLVDGGWITPSTENGSDRFSEMVRVGICGSGYEMGLESAFRAITPPRSETTNQGFIRPEAYLSMIFVSDEQDASPLPVNEYINAFRNVKGQRNRDIFNASALVVTDPDSCRAGSISREGTRYLDIANQTNGVIGNICADDFGDIVTELSLASSRLQDTFYLSDIPDVATLVVGIDDEEVPCDSGRYRYELIEEQGQEPQAVIVFDRAQMPPPNSRVTAKYDLGSGDPSEFCTGGSN
jgi:hypothetical protein